MSHCDVCDCTVPLANWYDHSAGRRHCENLTRVCNDDIDCCSDVDSSDADSDFDSSTFSFSSVDSLPSPPSTISHCAVCRCYVPCNVWYEHIVGPRHRSNGDNENIIKEELFHVVSAECVSYTVDAINATFSDGTTLADGVANLLRDIPRWCRRVVDWSSTTTATGGGVAPKYVIDVLAVGGGQYVAVNSRTLYCYVAAGFLYVPVNIVGRHSGERTFDSVRLRAS